MHPPRQARYSSRFTPALQLTVRREKIPPQRTELCYTTTRPAELTREGACPLWSSPHEPWGGVFPIKPFVWARHQKRGIKNGKDIPRLQAYGSRGDPGISAGRLRGADLRIHQLLDRDCAAHRRERARRAVRLLTRHLLPRHGRRVLRQDRRAQHQALDHDRHHALHRRPRGDLGRHQGAEPRAHLPRLRLPRGHRHGHHLHLPRQDDDALVPECQGPRGRPPDHLVRTRLHALHHPLHSRPSSRPTA